MHGLTRHRMAQHPQLSMTDNTEITQFKNKSLSITRIHSETQVPGTITKNQTTFRKVTAGVGTQSINARRAESKMKLGIGDGNKAPMRAPVKGTMTTAMKSIMGGVKMDDDTADWQKWEPVRDREESPPDMSTIITASVAERATSAFCEVPKTGANVLKPAPPGRKGPPRMYRLEDVMAGNVPKNGKRPAPGVNNSQRTTIAARSASASNTTAGTSPVVGIMQNLGKIRSMNQTASGGGRPNPKISLPAARSTTTAKVVTVAVAQQPPVEPFRVSKPPQVPKNKVKITPRNAFNNALPKPGTGPVPVQSARYRGGASMNYDEDDSGDEDDFADDDDIDDEDDDMEEIIDFPTYNPLLLDPNEVKKQPPAKKPVTKRPIASKPPAKNGKATAGGKAGARKAATNSSQRFNPVQIPTKKQPAILTQTAMRNGRSGKPPTAAAVAKTSASSPVVAKKSSPQKSENKLEKMKTHVSTMPGTEYKMPSISAVGSFTKENGGQVWICLVCNEKEEEQSSRDMICCDECEDWYHCECVGIFQSFPDNTDWYCKRCIYQLTKNPKKDFPKLF